MKIRTKQKRFDPKLTLPTREWLFYLPICRLCALTHCVFISNFPSPSELFSPNSWLNILQCTKMNKMKGKQHSGDYSMSYNTVPVVKINLRGTYPQNWFHHFKKRYILRIIFFHRWLQTKASTKQVSSSGSKMQLFWIMRNWKSSSST